MHAVVVDTRSERRRLTRNLLESCAPPLEIEEADSRVAVLELVDRLDPELVVLEIQMPLEEGLETIGALRRISPDLRLVVCSFHSDPGTISDAVERGADAYLVKPVSSTDMRAALGPLRAKPRAEALAGVAPTMSLDKRPR